MALLFKQLFPIRQVTKPLIPLRLSSFHTLFVALALWIDCPQTRDIKRFTKATHYSRKELRVSPPDSLPPPTQSNPARHETDESARTAQSHYCTVDKARWATRGALVFISILINRYVPTFLFTQFDCAHCGGGVRTVALALWIGCPQTWHLKRATTWSHAWS